LAFVPYGAADAFAMPRAAFLPDICRRLIHSGAARWPLAVAFLIHSEGGGLRRCMLSGRRPPMPSPLAVVGRLIHSGAPPLAFGAARWLWPLAVGFALAAVA
jgi:hypothetical protein